MSKQGIGFLKVFLAFDVDVVAITEVVAFAAASHIDETVYGLAFRQGLADVSLGFFDRNLCRDNQFDVEVLRVLYLFLVVHWQWLKKQNYDFSPRKTSNNFVFAIFAENIEAMAKKLNRIEFTLREGEDFIPLISLLKACDVVYSGAEAQEVVTAGMVLRNGEVETRKRAKITAGEVIVFENFEIFVEG